MKNFSNNFEKQLIVLKDVAVLYFGLSYYFLFVLNSLLYS